MEKCEEHKEREKDVETYFRTAKNEYEDSIKRLRVLVNRAYEIARVTGIIAAIIGAIFIFILKQGVFLFNWPLLWLGCGLIFLLMTTFLSLILVYSGRGLPTEYLLDPNLVIRAYKESNLSKEIVAEDMLKDAYHNLFVRFPNMRDKIDILLILATLGFILIIAGIFWIILAFSF